MLSIGARILLFVSSYFPLLIIFTIQNLNSHFYWALGLASLGVLSLIGLALFIHFVNTSSPRIQEVTFVQRKDTEVMAYIVTYIFPFLGLNFGDLNNIISLGIFFLILGVIYVNSNMISINPTLNLLGYHLYEIETQGGTIHTIISRRRRISKGDKLSVVVIGDDIMMERMNDNT